MPPTLRPRLESLEGRMLLSTVNAPAAPVAETFNFVAPGSETSGVHAVASQQATSVTLTLQRSDPYHSIQVEVATGPIPTPSTPVGSAQPEVPTILWGSRASNLPLRSPRRSRACSTSLSTRRSPSRRA